MRLFTSSAFSCSVLLGSSVITSTTEVLVYSDVSSQLICRMALCILMPKKYFGFRAIFNVALKVMMPLMLGMVAFRM
ncbi:hypothetical protein N868_08540 [Cellulomonas carbonis T26]|uniref:Uncharacterized protein n=1 Tax=Cellulomonas carbonis T26 TaxID=947969 RepID=A0A0A0BKV8_9CELL|nr:hypothetical protein N868_08540 [Cellulomonas carbonis T26]